MDVHGSPVSEDPWDVVLQLEGLGSVIKKNKKKMLCGAGSPNFQATWSIRLYCLCFDSCVSSHSAITPAVQSDLH